VEKKRLQNCLIVRTDRIGDVILTLPAVEALKSNFHSARVTMLVSSYTAGLVRDFADYLLYTDSGGAERPFFEILREIRDNKFDCAVVAYPRVRIALLLWFAGIPVRVGTGYRWYSFLFNKRVYEHRKTAEKHEAEYNLSLLKALGCILPRKPEVHIKVTEEERNLAKRARVAAGIPEDARLALLHPGSGGSAREWRPGKFVQLAAELDKLGFCVAITGAVKEEELVKKIALTAGGGVKPFVSKLELREFAAFIESAKIFIANSTGPLHISAAVGTPVIGFYPPVRVMSPERWGPLTSRKKIFIPDPKNCPRCKGGRCRGNDCMEQIEVRDVVEAVLKTAS
jgi:heptosyltransferase-3